jgi:hypothetical protein
VFKEADRELVKVSAKGYLPAAWRGYALRLFS